MGCMSAAWMCATSPPMSVLCKVIRAAQPHAEDSLATSTLIKQALTLGGSLIALLPQAACPRLCCARSQPLPGNS